MRLTYLILAAIAALLLTHIVAAQSYQVSFTVNKSGYVTIYLSGPSSADSLDLHWGIESAPQGNWIQVFDTMMKWNGKNFTATIGPISNGTWIAWVFHDETTNTWINYQNHPFWNWNLEVNPPNLGYTYAEVLGNASILITAIGRAPDPLILHFGLTTGPQTGLPWSDITNVTMQYNPLWGNYSAVIGPFKQGQWIQWVYYDPALNKWLSNKGQNYAIEETASSAPSPSTTFARVLPNGSVLITVVGKPPDTFILHFGLTTGPQTGLPWSDITNVTMQYNPLWGNYSAVIGPFKQGQWIQWVYYDATTNTWYNNYGQNFAILVNYTAPAPPIYLNIVFNDHQPLYTYVGSNVYLLPWAAVHLAEYAEQALIIHMFPTVHVTYSLSGSLLYQIEAIAAGDYNNTYILAALIPQSQWNNTLYQEIKQYNYTFLEAFAPSYEWNTTTVRQVLEFDLAFNTPLWVYSANTPASRTYAQLFSLEQKGIPLNNEQLTNALVEWFLWSISYPIVTGQLGSQYANSTIASLYDQSSFNISDIRLITSYYPVEARIVLDAFKMDRMNNNNTGGNVEIITTPFDHPLTPLLLIPSWTGENGNPVIKGAWTSDVLAQINIGRDLYKAIFGQYPMGMWSPEMAISSAMIPLLNESGYYWTYTSESTLAEANVTVPTGPNPTPQEMENLYQPYRVIVGNSSIVIAFRDGTLSNAWGFNYGEIAATQGNWAAVNQFMNYLRHIYDTIPASHHNDTLVTVALDGENWMFMSPFPEDGVPFLIDLYTALAGNSSWVQTTTMQQYLSTHHDLAELNGIPMGSWNNQGPAGTVSPFYTQWAGHSPQDAIWQQLAIVRSMVLQFGKEHNLTQPLNFTQITEYNDFPFLGTWNTSTLEGRYVEAWMSIYGAEGSDIYFTFDPNDQSLTSQNAIVFEIEARQDMINALKVLGLPLTPFLADQWHPPLKPSITGTNTSITPPMTGYLYNFIYINGKRAYSINNNFAWSGSYQYVLNKTEGAGGINTVYYAFDANDLYIDVKVNGNPLDYVAPNALTTPKYTIYIYFSPINPGMGDLMGLNIPDANYTAAPGVPLGFAATRLAEIFVGPGSNDVAIYESGPSGWTYVTSIPNAVAIGDSIEIAIPFSALGINPGDSIEFSVATVNESSGSLVNLIGPMMASIPSNIAKLTPVMSIYNPAPSNGPGYYVYPLLTANYPPGSVWMRWVNVSMNDYLVQFNITFGNLTNVYDGPNGFSQPIIDIYIHEGNEAGCTNALPGVNAKIAQGSAWQWVIQAAGWPSNSYVESCSGQTYTTPLIVKGDLATKTVSIEVPTSLIGSNITGYSYVIIAGFQDGYATNGWDPVYPNATDYQGGGAKTPYAPNIFSYIAPNLVNPNSPLTQQAVLSNYTNTSYATLYAVKLPLLKASTQSTTMPQAKPSLSIIGYDNSTGSLNAFYLMGNKVYWSTSSNGEIWSQPKPIINATGTVVSLSYDPAANALLVAYSNGLTMVKLSPLIEATSLTVQGVAQIYSASIASLGGSYYVLAATPGKVLVINASGSIIGSVPINASGVSAASYGGMLYAAISSGGSIYFTSGSPNNLAKPQLLLSEPAGYSLVQPSLGVYGNEIALGYSIESGSGTNIGYSYGPLSNLTSEVLTTDGQEYSPSIVLIDPGTALIYMGFTSSAGAGNVYFISQPLASLQQAPSTSTSSPPSSTSTAVPSSTVTSVTTSTSSSITPPPPSTSTVSSSSSQGSLIAVIIVIVVVVIIGAYLAVRRRH